MRPEADLYYGTLDHGLRQAIYSGLQGIARRPRRIPFRFDEGLQGWSATVRIESHGIRLMIVEYVIDEASAQRLHVPSIAVHRLKPIYGRPLSYSPGPIPFRRS